jgi:hypothetical protein
MKHPHLAAGQDVEFVTADKKNQKAKITQVINADVARLEWDNGKHAAVSVFSDTGEPGTFSFPASVASPTAGK